MIGGNQGRAVDGAKIGAHVGQDDRGVIWLAPDSMTVENAVRMRKRRYSSVMKKVSTGTVLVPLPFPSLYHYPGIFIGNIELRSRVSRGG